MNLFGLHHKVYGLIFSLVALKTISSCAGVANIRGNTGAGDGNPPTASVILDIEEIFELGLLPQNFAFTGSVENCITGFARHNIASVREEILIPLRDEGCQFKLQTISFGFPGSEKIWNLSEENFAEGQEFLATSTDSTYKVKVIVVKNLAPIILGDQTVNIKIIDVTRGGPTTPPIPTIGVDVYVGPLGKTALEVALSHEVTIDPSNGAGKFQFDLECEAEVQVVASPSGGDARNCLDADSNQYVDISTFKVALLEDTSETTGALQIDTCLAALDYDNNPTGYIPGPDREGEYLGIELKPVVSGTFRGGIQTPILTGPGRLYDYRKLVLLIGDGIRCKYYPVEFDLPI